MKTKLLTLLSLLVCCACATFGQNNNGCVNGQRHGITYTDCWADTGDDTARLQAAFDWLPGKIVFNENDYRISEAIEIKYSYRILEGTNNNPYQEYASFAGAIITQTVSGKSIFEVGEGILEISIRDLALVGAPGTTGTVGLKAIGDNGSSGMFQLSNLHFRNLDKGIYVTGTDSESQYQFDNVRLDHSAFTNCNNGVYLDSYNSGWHISSVSFDAPAGAYGFYFKKSTYTSIDFVTGNGPQSSPYAEALFYIEHHANLTIKNTVTEGFNQDVNINSPAHMGPIYLLNNHFNGKVTVNNTMVISTGNGFGYPTAPDIDAIAKGTSYIFSFGDRFCHYNNPCTNGWQLEDSARVIFNSDPFKTSSSVPSFITRDITAFDPTPSLSLIAPTIAAGPLLRLGRGTFHYDLDRMEDTADAGSLRFTGNQAGYGGYVFKTQGGQAKINYDGSVTYGSKSYASLGSGDNGTVVYCTDCQQTAACTSGGSGAMAKRIAGGWVCN
jgi:hypothetical protein